MNDSKDPTDKYPGPRNASEAVRLRAQHDLCTAALGGNLVHCPIDLSRPSLRILDSGTADGYWLFALLQDYPALESAELIGTDIAPFKENSGFQRPENLKLMKQDILKEWPSEWEGTFDFVHQRNAIANTGNWETAVATVRKLIRLVKPGGWIQIVDGYIPMNEEVQDEDQPSMKMFKHMGKFLGSNGLDASIGSRLERLMIDANDHSLEDIGFKEGTARIGRGAETTELYETGFVQVRGLGDGMKAALSGAKNPPVSVDEWSQLKELVMQEAVDQGFDMYWYSTWARKL